MSRRRCGRRSWRRFWLSKRDRLSSGGFFGADRQAVPAQEMLERQLIFKQLAPASRQGGVDVRKAPVRPPGDQDAGLLEEFPAGGAAARVKRLHRLGFRFRQFAAGEGPEAAEEFEMLAAQDGEDLARAAAAREKDAGSRGDRV